MYKITNLFVWLVNNIVIVMLKNTSVQYDTDCDYIIYIYDI